MEENYKLAKWLEGTMTNDELAAFKADPDYLLYEKIKFQTSQLKTPDFDKENMLKSILKSDKSKPKIISLYKNWFYKVAAVFAIVLGITYVFTSNSSEIQVAENGKKTEFLLPDNSQVLLNSGSKIEYKNWNWNSNRKLDLDGEAYFKVAKGKTFEVNTNLGKVTVLGTQFNVKAREKRFDVTCYEGRVKINYNATKIIISKGQSVSFLNKKLIDKSEILTQKPEWINNELVFNNAEISYIISELERQFNVSISFKKPETNQLFTGKIPTNNLDVALRIITSTYHLEVKKINASEIILETINDKK